MMQLCILFSNNKTCIAYHEIVAGKTFGDLKALFPTDEEWNAFATGAATYLEKAIWYGLFGYVPDGMTYDDARSEANLLAVKGLISGVKIIPTSCHDKASAKKLMANYGYVLVCYPALRTVLTFKMDEEKKVRALRPRSPFALHCATAHATMLQEDQETILQGCLTPRSRKTELAIADERRARKMEIEALKMQLRDSQEKTEVAVARGENMTMKILDMQHTLMCKVDHIAELKKQLEETRAERDAAREDAQKKTATLAERDERIASLEKCIAVIASATQSSAAAAAAPTTPPAAERLRLAIAGWRGPPPSPEEDDINQQDPPPPSA
jgi:hypothetical protein